MDRETRTAREITREKKKRKGREWERGERERDWGREKERDKSPHTEMEQLCLHVCDVQISDCHA